MSNCLPCRSRLCENPADVVIYSLQNDVVFNSAPLSFVVQCLDGLVCAPGTFPRTIVYPIGTFSLPIPTDPLPGFPIILQMMGCQSLVSTTLPEGSSQAAMQAAAEAIITLVAAQQAECDAIPALANTGSGPSGPATPALPPFGPAPAPLPLFFNEEVTADINCPISPEPVVYYKPSWITQDTALNILVGAAGAIGGATQAEANSTAQGIIDALALTANCNAPNFALMAWTVDSQTQTNGGTSSFTPAIGVPFTAAAAFTAPPPAGDSSVGAITVTGNLTTVTPWSGRCHIHAEIVVVNSTGLPFPIISISAALVDVYSDGVKIVDGQLYPPGLTPPYDLGRSFDFDFNVTGVTSIDVEILLTATNDDAEPQALPLSMVVTGTLTNVSP